MGLFSSIGTMLKAFTNIFVNSAGMVDEFVGAGKDLGTIARLSAKDLKSETKRNSRHNKVVSELKFNKKEEKLRAKLAKSGVTYQTQAEVKAAKKAAKQAKFDEALKAAMAEAEAAKNTSTPKTKTTTTK